MHYIRGAWKPWKWIVLNLGMTQLGSFSSHSHKPFRTGVYCANPHSTTSESNGSRTQSQSGKYIKRFESMGSAIAGMHYTGIGREHVLNLVK